MAIPRFAGPADLHLHSQHSDGTQSPAALMHAVFEHGVRTAALTDHDTTSGWEEAARAATSLGMAFIPGMEMSARYGWRSVHILAYLIDPANEGLAEMTTRVRTSRHERVRTMTDRIAADYDLTWQDVLAQMKTDATVGRPHIADALVAKGIVVDRAEAFAGILSARGPYYVQLYAPDPVTAVELIIGAGGVPIIAHPAGRAGILPADVLNGMLAAGLAGFELGHRENRQPGIGVLEKLAGSKNLIVTGSSDYHGAGKPNLPGEYITADAMVQRIIDQGHGADVVYP